MLTTLPNPSDEWDVVATGYLVVRLFDDWCELGPSWVAGDIGVPILKERIRQLPDVYDRYRQLYEQSVETLISATTSKVQIVVAPLLAYAALLEGENRWALSADVYATIADSLENDPGDLTPDFPTIAFAKRREGYACRSIQKYVQAEKAYYHSIEIADQIGDRLNAIAAKLGLITMIRIRGNLPLARQMLNDLYEECVRGGEGVESMQAPILHLRATVKQVAGEFSDAVADYFLAYQCASDEETKEHILNDLGTCALDAGYRDTARHTLRYVAAKSSNRVDQETAIVNLIWLAVMDGDQLEFEKCRRKWNPTTSSTLINVVARVHIAQGVERFGSRSEAIAAWKEAAEFAGRAKVHKHEFEALTALERLENIESAQPAYFTIQPTPVPDSLMPVADALYELYILAETSA